jgi:hypothetical protein
MEEGGRLRGEDLGETLVKAFKMLLGGGIQEAIAGSQEDLGDEALVDEEIDPAGRWGISLGQGAHVVVVVEAKGRLADPMEAGELLAPSRL